MTDNKDTLIIDLDNTLTQAGSSQDYSKKLVNKQVALAVNNAISLGYASKIFSARNMRSFKGDMAKIESVTRPIAEAWLYENNIEHDELILGKPWCGFDGWYLDDKNISIEEFIFKFSGPYWNQTVNIIIPFFNEENNIVKTHLAHQKLERLFNISNYIYVDNGSNDRTSDMLKIIDDEKIKIVTIKENIGYGNGIKAGLLESSSDLVFLNHGDLQFDPYSFIYANLESLTNIQKPLNIFPQRLNRPIYDNINSFVLRLILSSIYLRKIPDFNGQPKLIFKNSIKNIDLLPNNFCIDLGLYNLCKSNVLGLPVVQKWRETGESSWSNNLSKRIKIFIDYILYALKNMGK